MKISAEYLAGFFDGEGYIGLLLHADRRSLKSLPEFPIRYSYDLSISITQTLKDETVSLLESIKNTVGVGVIKPRSPRGRQKYPTVEYRLDNHKDCLIFLNYIEPRLILKKEQCDLFKKAMLIIKNNMAVNARGTRYLSADGTSKLLDLIEKMESFTRYKRKHIVSEIRETMIAHHKKLAIIEPIRGRRWKEEEINKLKKLIPQMSLVKIAKELGRPPSSVYAKCYSLGLAKHSDAKTRKTCPYCGENFFSQGYKTHLKFCKSKQVN